MARYSAEQRHRRWATVERLRGDGATYRDIGDALGVSASRAWQLHGEAIANHNGRTLSVLANLPVVAFLPDVPDSEALSLFHRVPAYRD
jgi:hypothetical protein